ncbi:GNAT family N-acetyltransferase [Dactylosporangium vinaceum]|uniref:GNAT family N-acetyltransferase n=1 Tax=Dactylosporangium vinaceum TaxID=53362 RepID=A0ABV5MD62_9ACTN|nr:GNAT family N-acetyltransferase [Dactylosporangium vinaceum]UAC00835.1 GNAT family N-acetyltransferase [Dactylosporangium vinaceum]
MTAIPLEPVAVPAIADVDAEAWTSIAGRSSAYSSHRWLQYVQTHTDADVVYLLARREGTVVAGLPSYLFPGDVPKFYDPQWLLRDEWRGERRPVVLGGVREGYRSEILTSDTLPEPERDAAVALLLSQLRHRRARHDAIAAILYLPDRALELLAPLLGPGDRRFVVDAEAVIAVPEGGLPAYLADLPGKRRATVRRDQERFDRSGCLLQESDLADCYADLGRLSAHLLGRYGRHVDPDAEVHRFQRQAASTAGMNRVFLARRDGRLVGFAHFLIQDDIMYARSGGFDYSIAREAALYFNLVYYTAIRYAAQRGVKFVNYGCDALQAKVFRGARLHPLWAVLIDADQCGLGHLDYAAAERRALAPIAALDDRVVTDTVRTWSPNH